MTLLSQVLGVGRGSLKLLAKRRWSSVFLVVTLLSSIFMAAVPDFTSNAYSSSLQLIAPPDKTLTALAGANTTKAGLGTPLVPGGSSSTVTFAHDAPGSTTAPSGAVAYWNFDNNLEDSSGNLNHGIASGDAHVEVSQMGRALLLDGDEDYVVVQDSSSLRLAGAFTISAWMNLDTLAPSGDYTRIVEKGTTASKYWMFYVKATKKIGFGFFNSGTDISIQTVKTDWQAGKWYHIVGTYDPAGGTRNMKIYVNSVMNNQITKTGSPIANFEPLKFGVKNNDLWDYWDGGIDEVMIYNRALTASEIADLNKAPFVSLPTRTNIVTWTATDDVGNSATAVQVVNIKDSTAQIPLTTQLAINGIRYLDPASDTMYVTSKTHFDLSRKDGSTGPAAGTTYFRYFKAGDLYSFRPEFSIGTYFRINGNNDEYIVQFYSVDESGNSEQLNQRNVILDNSSPVTTSNIVDGAVAGNLELAATDNGGGAGVGQKPSISGIFYKIGSETTYTFVQSDVVDLTGLPGGLHTIYYYGVDNVGNKENIKITQFGKATFTFCTSGCDYNNLQTAVNSLPAEGGLIYVAAGSYIMSNTITLKSGTALEFSDQASIYFRGDMKPLFKGTGVSDVQIIGGRITAERTGVKAFAFWDSNTVTVDGAVITLVKGSNSNGFYCVDCTDIHVLNLDVTNSTRAVDFKTSSGVNDGRSSNLWVENGIFDEASIEGIKINDSTDVHIIGNEVTNTNENGIDIGWNINTEVRDNRLINTGVPNGAAIHTDSANGANVTNNYIDTTGKTAIPIYRASNINVIGNTIINAGDQGISVIDSINTSSYAKVMSNHIISPVGHGIYVSPNQFQVEVAYNILEDISPTKKSVLVIWSNNATVEVHDNTVA